MIAAKQQNTRKQGRVTWAPCTENGHDQCMRGTLDGLVEPVGHVSWDKGKWDKGKWKGSVTDSRTATYDWAKTRGPITDNTWSDNIQQMAEHVQGQLEETHRKSVQDREKLERAQGEIDNFLAQEPDGC